MRTVGVEEHFVPRELQAAWDGTGPDDSRKRPRTGEIGERLTEVGERRIAAMDAAGLDVQVLSTTGPGVQNLPPAQAAGLQVELNDHIAELVRARPDRFEGFAAIATPAPAAGAADLERAVTKLGLQGAMLYGRTGDRNLDHPDNWPIFEAAAALRAPLYIHPQPPQQAVRDAIYSGFDPAVDQTFASSGIGWHYESGIQFMRLALAGVLDRFPDLRIILGHWGEVVLFFFERCDQMARRAGLGRTFSEYARHNVWVTAGGVYSQRYMRWAVEVVGADHVMFASDYPYQSGPDGGVEHFIITAGLDPADHERIASGNWERLVAEIRR